MITPEQARYHWAKGYAGSPKRSSGPTGTTPVGTFPSNPFGLCDMHGNVSEWVQDCYRSDYRDARKDGSAVTTTASTDPRVLRGGSWMSGPGYLRSASRIRNMPDIRISNSGFRVARIP